MTTHKPPGTGAARHGSGDADLTLMISAHQAFSRDLVSLARAAGPADLANPVRRQAVGNGWRVFKRQLHAHHRSEDEFIWPTLGGRCPTATAPGPSLPRWRKNTRVSIRCSLRLTPPSPSPRMTGSPTSSTPWPPP